VNYPRLLSWPPRPVAWFLRLLNRKRSRHRHSFSVRPRLEALETRIVPSTFTLPLVNQTGLNRASILAAYTPFMQGQGAAGDPYLPLVFGPGSIAGQAGGIVNPGRYLADGANAGSPLNTVWNSTLTTLFQTPSRTVSMIADDQAYYKGTPMRVGSSWVLHFVGYTDAAETHPNGNVFNVYSPLTPDPLGPRQTNESAGEMVFANDAVFADASSNVIISGPASVALGLERDLVAALNRGVALLGPTDGLNGDDSAYWGTETNWYPAGQTENLFSMFMHTATVNGTPLFTLPNGAVKDAQGTLMASAYGFAFDESPVHVPVGQPNVPSKFDPVPNGTTTVTIALGPWSQQVAQPPPPTSSGPPPSGPSALQVAEAAAVKPWAPVSLSPQAPASRSRPTPSPTPAAIASTTARVRPWATLWVAPVDKAGMPAPVWVGQHPHPTNNLFKGQRPITDKTETPVRKARTVGWAWDRRGRIQTFTAPIPSPAVLPRRPSPATRAAKR
jgi:hypothetical protein